MDKNKDITDTAQLITFIGGIYRSSDVHEELVSVCSLNGTVTNKGLFLKLKATLAGF
jgi:hypothetical protein